jgi:hypothetical protein
LLRGEDLELVSRSLGVTAATLTAWRHVVLAVVTAISAYNSPLFAYGEEAIRSMALGCWPSPAARRA